MNIVTVLHNKAMEFADEALLAKMEGNREVSHSLFEKAFSLEKEATTLIDQKNDSWYILVRSAASLALNCGRFQDAESLIQLGLSGTPPSFIVKELKDLSNTLSDANKKKVSEVDVIGIITYANAEESQIRLQDLNTGHGAQRLLHALVAATVNGLAVDHRDPGRYALQLGFGASRGDDDVRHELGDAVAGLGLRANGGSGKCGSAEGAADQQIGTERHGNPTER